ncbi:MAG: FAD-dependent oxidoreductase [Polyangiaceae bacterium]|nr:FAD-dependent oxidoreductase [Polyangiaceae bacterium]
MRYTAFMLRATQHIAVAGGGIFGITAAIALRERGYQVTVFDPGKLPHPLAESTDISKVVRMDYGADEAYLALMEEAMEGWDRYNARWPKPLYHPTGVMFLTRSSMAEGGFELESYRRLVRRGHACERLDEAEIRRRFPAWRGHTDGYFNPTGGYAESGKVVVQLVREAVAAGVVIREDAQVTGIHSEGSKAAGLIVSGEVVKSDHVVVAAGAWTGALLPHLASEFRPVGQPVFHLVPEDPSLFRADRFPVFGADISRTGYYGFPVTEDGIVKIANHGAGRIVDPAGVREVNSAEESALRAFVSETFPDLDGTRLAATRLCVYCDTHDGHFWIARDPDHEGLTVAAGGSGHAFKFAPVLGNLIADAMEGRERPALSRFRHRPGLVSKSEEAARHQG